MKRTVSDARRCRAWLSDGSRRCRLPPIRGGTVCHKHGGSAPAVRAKAQARLLEAVEPAIAALRKALDVADVRATIAAARELLDRAGIGFVKATDSRHRFEPKPPVAEQIIVLRLPDNGRGLASVFDGDAEPETPVHLAEPDDAGDVGVI